MLGPFPARPEPERRPKPESLGGRPVAEDQAPDRPAMVGTVQRVGDRGEPSFPDLHLDLRVGEQVLRPVRVVARRDQDGAIGFVDIADRDRSRQTAATATCRESSDLSLEEEVAADVVRQRARCQDLPSVWVDGA